MVQTTTGKKEKCLFKAGFEQGALFISTGRFIKKGDQLLSELLQVNRYAAEDVLVYRDIKHLNQII